MIFPTLYRSACPRALERWCAWLLTSDALGVYSLDEVKALERFLGE